VKHIIRNCASKGARIRDSRSRTQPDQGRPVQSSPAQCKSAASEGSSTGRVGVLAIPPVLACIQDTRDFFFVKNNRGTAVPRFSW
jgi:hypothetical protein